jgi:ABC-type dipeptide/oligopeptide/nickel transport system permease subunit
VIRIGVALVGLFAAMTAFGPLVAPYDPTSLSAALLQGPSPTHVFGTDEFGRDVLSRVLVGARLAFRLGLVSVVVALGIGGLLGLVSAYYGGWLDTLLQRVMEWLLAFPELLFVLAVVAMLGPSLDAVIFALGVFAIPGYVRVVRSVVLSAREAAYVEAARALGASDRRIMLVHLLPNVYAPALVLSTLRFGAALLAGSGLSFIGLGAQPPTPEWGAIMATGREYLLDAWWITFFPGVLIALSVLGVNLLGDGLRDRLDPALRGR